MNPEAGAPTFSKLHLGNGDRPIAAVEGPPTNDRSQDEGQQQLVQQVIPGNPFAYPEYESKTQLCVGVGLSMAMNLIYVIPNSFALFFFGLLAWTNDDNEMYFGFALSACLFIIGAAALVTDIILCCYLNSLPRSSYTLTYWFVLYLVYMSVVGIQLILFIAGLNQSQEKNYNKVWLSNLNRDHEYRTDGEHYDDLPLFKAVPRPSPQEYGNRRFHVRGQQYYETAEDWVVEYKRYRDGAIACFVIAIIFLTIRAYYHFIAFKVRKALQASPAAAAAARGRIFSPVALQPAVIPQYYVGHDGGGGAPYYNNSNSYPPMEKQP